MALDTQVVAQARVATVARRVAPRLDLDTFAQLLRPESQRIVPDLSVLQDNETSHGLTVDLQHPRFVHTEPRALGAIPASFQKVRALCSNM